MTSSTYSLSLIFSFAAQTNESRKEREETKNNQIPKTIIGHPGLYNKRRTRIEGKKKQESSLLEMCDLFSIIKGFAAVKHSDRRKKPNRKHSGKMRQNKEPFPTWC